jgi:hypothetical protein
VGKALELRARCGDDLRVRVPDVQAPDAAGEVDEGVPVDVGERRAVSLGGGDRELHVEGTGDGGLLPDEDLL